MKTNNIEPQVTSHASRVTNNTFSIKRFGSYAATELRANRHFLITMIWVTAAVHVGLILISYFLFQESLNDANQTIYRVMGVGSGVAVAILISGSLKNYHNSMTAPRVMMLPTARSEKFTYTLLYSVVLLPIVISAVVMLITLIICAFTPDSYSFTITDVMTIRGTDANIDYTFNPYWKLIIDGLLIYLAYFLGSALFRRAQFILSSVSIIAFVFILGSTLIYYVAFTTSDTFNREHIMEFTFSIQILMYSLIPATIILSWLRFRSLQLKK